MHAETLAAIWSSPVHWSLKFVASAVAQGERGESSLLELERRTEWADAVLREAISSGCRAGLLHVVSERGPDGSPVIGIGAAWRNPLASERQKL